MANSAFQYVIDHADTLAINKKKKVAQTVSRDGVVKSISLGGQVWEFNVKLPDGPAWTDWRGMIEQIEALDMVTTGTIQISSAGHSWINGYQGNMTILNNTTATVTTGNTISISSATNGALVGGYKFRSGDFIQMGTGGKVYTVVNDVPYNGTSVTLNRPVRDAAGTYTLVIGQNVQWTVICTQIPQWTMFQRNQISWSGPFIFSEVV